MRQLLQNTLYRYGWDTRCRNLVPVRMLRPDLAQVPARSEPILLDVGCGRLGIAAFLPGVTIMGTDVEPPEEAVPGFSFQPGSITDLPFDSQSYPVVTCIDVLEHLPLDARAKAVQELVRVTAQTLLIACPHGATAQQCDAAFREACKARGRPVPPWVNEHQGQAHPDRHLIIQQVREAARASGREVKITMSYCEPARVCRLVRAAAARSGILYALTNLLMGVLFPLLSAPNSRTSYRMILVARFSD